MKKSTLTSFAILCIGMFSASCSHGQNFNVQPELFQNGPNLQTDPALLAIGKKADELNDLGDKFNLQGDWPDASKAYNQVLLLNPNNNYATECLAHHAYLVGDDQTAITLYRKCVYDGTRVMNFGYRPLGELAILLSNNGQIDEALRLYQTSRQTFGDEWGKYNYPIALPDYSPRTGLFLSLNFKPQLTCSQASDVCRMTLALSFT